MNRSPEWVAPAARSPATFAPASLQAQTQAHTARFKFRRRQAAASAQRIAAGQGLKHRFNAAVNSISSGTALRDQSETSVEAPPFDAGLHIETTTIVFADVVESVRLIEQDETANVIRIRSLLQRLAEVVAPAHQGTLLERRGDGLLLKFAEPRNAAACALEIHAHAASASLGRSAEDTVALRIGMHCAEVIIDDSAVYGRGINLAARVTTLAGPGETVVSATVRDRLTHPIDGDLRDLGECYLKNLVEPVRAYQLQPVDRAMAGAGAGSATAAALAAALDLGWATLAAPNLPAADATGSAHCVTIAVLPLATPQAHAGADAPVGADVFVDQLTASLSQSPLLRVISSMSANAFRGRRTAQTAAGHLLSAHYVLAGRCDENGGRMAAQLELVHCGSGEVVWAQVFLCSPNDVLSTSSDVIARAVAEVMAALTRTELTIAHGRPLPNLAAHTLYLSAVTLLHRFSRTDFERAHLMLQTLRERAPRNAAPAAWLARWHVFKIVQGWSADNRRDGAQASDYAQRALDHDPKSSLALAMAGSVEAGVNRDMAAARNYYDLSLASNPNEPLAWLLKGVAHGFMGEAAAALDSSERSLALTPLDPLRFYYDSLSSSAASAAQSYPRAIELAERAIRANCMHGSAYRTLAVAQVMVDAVDDARETIRRLLAVEPASSVRQFLARAAVNSEQNQRFARALATAGLPMG
jgi:adenylate cyclase